MRLPYSLQHFYCSLTFCLERITRGRYVGILHNAIIGTCSRLLDIVRMCARAQMARSRAPTKYPNIGHKSRKYGHIWA